ncbi:MAG: hypothetical protein ACW975_02265 [Candidatus Thorarchaeota archaeon]
MSKTTKKKKKKPDLLRPTGVGLSVKLYKYEGTKSNAAQIATALKKVKYAPKSKKHVGAGFAKVSATGKTVQGEIIAGFKVPILTYGTGGRLEPVHYISVSKAQVFVTVKHKCLSRLEKALSKSEGQSVSQESSEC